MRRFIATIIALFVTTGLSAEELVWIKDGKHEGTQELQAGKFIEVCANIAAGERFGWKFDAEGRLDFNIHYHIDELVGRPVVLEGVRHAAAQFEPRHKRDYCWTWVNKSKEPIKLSLQIRKL